MKHRHHWYWLLVLTLLSPCARAAEIDAAAPDFVLPTLKQERVQLGALKGKVVYLDFWASWCGPCRKTFPWMNQMQNKYAKDGLQIVAVNLDESRTQAEEFLAKIPPEFQILLDPQRKISKLYRIKGVPMSFVIDRKGVLRAVHLGTAPEHFVEVEAQLQQLLGETN